MLAGEYPVTRPMPYLESIEMIIIIISSRFSTIQQLITSGDMSITTPSSVPGPIAKPRSNSTSSNYSSESSSHIGCGYQRAPGSEREREENTFVSIVS